MSDVAIMPAIAGATPRRVHNPTTLDELRSLVVEHGDATLVPGAGGTRLELGNPPSGPFELVEVCAALQGDLEHNADDMTLVAPAGFTIAAVNEQLAASGQRLAWDPPQMERATVGGTLAVGANGPLASRYGQPRDHLLGATLLRADGELVKAGGRVVKNVTGYDLMRLWCGSLGTLGLFTSVALRVFPAVESVHLVFERTTIERAVELAEALYRADIRAEALDVTGGAGDWWVHAEVPASAEATARGIGGWCERSEETAYSTTGTTGWHDDDVATAYVRCLPGRIAAIAGYLADMGARLVTRPVTATIITTWPEAPDLDATLIAVAERVRAELPPLEGSLVFERLPSRLRAFIDAWGEAPPALPIMRRLKQAYDPAGRFNRGRFVGGI